MTTTLIDGDIVAYRCGWASNNDPEDINHLRSGNLIQEILDETQADSYELYLTGDTNFRITHNPFYKANRKDTERPRYLQSIREYLVTEWGAIVTDGNEADDMLGIVSREYKDSIICSIDKDLLQIPGKHWNFVKKEYKVISEWQGMKFFYEQLLVGDPVDNIIGVKGIGVKKAERHLQWAENEYDMFEICQGLYDDDVRLLMNGICLKIQQYEGELWKFPTRPNESEVEDQTDSLSL